MLPSRSSNSMPEFESSEVNEIGFLKGSHPFLNKESAAQS